MLVVKDASVLIHLSKLSLLEKSCDYFGRVMAPLAVNEEIMAGKEKGFGDAQIVEALIKKRKIVLREAGAELIEKAFEFNVQGGEAQAVALYWQEKANLIATDDDSVRRKKELLKVNVIGTPAIVLTLRKNRKISNDKFINSISLLRRIGWFSNAVIDKILMEG